MWESGIFNYHTACWPRSKHLMNSLAYVLHEELLRNGAYGDRDAVPPRSVPVFSIITVKAAEPPHLSLIKGTNPLNHSFEVTSH